MIFCYFKSGNDNDQSTIEKLQSSLSKIKNLDHPTTVALDKDGENINILVSILDPIIKSKDISKLKTSSFALSYLIKDSQQEIQLSIDSLPLAKQKIKDLKTESIIESNRLQQEFKFSDLKAVDLRFADLNDSLREYFTGMNVFSIFWRAAYLGGDIKLRLEQHALQSTENSVFLYSKS
jgi:hypothetical protein